MIRQVVFGLVLSAGLSAWSATDFQTSPPAKSRPPVEIPFARLKADAIVPLALEPGAVESPDAVWIPSRDAATVVRVDAKENKPGQPMSVGAAPCASLAVGFDSVWVPLCPDGGTGTVARVDPKTSKVTTSLKTAVATADGRIATAVGSIWAITDRRGVLSRIDPDSNTPVAEVYVAGGAVSVVFGEDALWITSEDENRLTRVNPHNNEIVELIEVGPRPGRLAVGEGGVWTLNRGNGSITRVDPATNKVVATIPIGDGAVEGEIAAGAGSVWVSAPGVPIIRIDPRTNLAVQRFTGEGGGAILVAHGSLWVAAGPTITWRLDPLLVSSMRP
jgi:YVTN family beta-propeller protein